MRAFEGRFQGERCTLVADMDEPVYTIEEEELAAIASLLLEIDDARLAIDTTGSESAGAAVRKIADATFAINDVLQIVLGRRGRG